MSRFILKIFAVILVFSGMVFLAHPYINEYKYQKENKKIIEKFEKARLAIKDIDFSAIDDIDKYIENNELSSEQIKYLRLYKSFSEYNIRIYQEKQSTLCDAFSYTTNDFDFRKEGIDDDVLGYINISGMNLTIPLYIGANEVNMAKGATVLNQTSMPIGGANTNCVIAAHRGYRGVPMFRDIECIGVGDNVHIVNLWEELDYVVIKTAVIDPYNIDAIKIIPDFDMVTLITCHPYSKNYQRYVVYCVRDKDIEKVYSDSTDISEKNDANKKIKISDKLPSTEVTDSSEKDIELEKTLFLVGFGICGFLFVFIIYRTVSDIIIEKKKKLKSD